MASKQGHRIKDISGQVFGLLTVLEYAGTIHYGTRTGSKGARSQWLCRCSCGVEKTIAGDALRKGNTQSCGCVLRAKNRKRLTTHGKARTPEYDVWHVMKCRCLLPNYPGFKSYGARGVTVCKRWLDSFENFIADMGPRPSNKHSIDRIDSNGNYEPSNCRWATRSEQQRNRRDNHRLTFNGETLCLVEWAERYGLQALTLYYRIKKGWPVSEAITTPVGLRRKH